MVTRARHGRERGSVVLDSRGGSPLLDSTLCMHAPRRAHDTIHPPVAHMKATCWTQCVGGYRQRVSLPCWPPHKDRETFGATYPMPAFPCLLHLLPVRCGLLRPQLLSPGPRAGHLLPCGPLLSGPVGMYPGAYNCTGLWARRIVSTPSWSSRLPPWAHASSTPHLALLCAWNLGM